MRVLAACSLGGAGHLQPLLPLLDVARASGDGRQLDLSTLGELPDNVHVERWVDQADVFPEADVVVCHRGSGTTFGALAAAVPLVVVPLFADQFVNAQTVGESGAGAVVDSGRDDDGRRLPLTERDAPRIAEAITTVLASPWYGARARRIADDMAGAPELGVVLDQFRGRREASPVSR